MISAQQIQEKKSTPETWKLVLKQLYHCYNRPLKVYLVVSKFFSKNFDFSWRPWKPYNSKSDTHVTVNAVNSSIF